MLALSAIVKRVQAQLRGGRTEKTDGKVMLIGKLDDQIRWYRRRTRCNSVADACDRGRAAELAEHVDCLEHRVD
jgi:hypothetical protein